MTPGGTPARTSATTARITGAGSATIGAPSDPPPESQRVRTAAGGTLRGPSPSSSIAACAS